jgi:NAD(P)H-hydrate repair Nnr-like enzyme with NAD(P)H-hydrate dehydratase domain
MPLVIDADGLNAFHRRPDHWRDARPRRHHHAASGRDGAAGRDVHDEVQASRLEIARNFAIAHHVFVVLKGRRTLIARRTTRCSSTRPAIPA